MIITSVGPHEGEPASSMQPTMGNKNDSLKRKRDKNDEEEGQHRMRTRKKPRIDYCYLNNPFPDEEEIEMNLSSEEQTYSIIPGDEYI